MNRTDIKSMTLQELKQDMVQIGEKEYRAKQIYEWIHKKQVDSFQAMSNLSKECRERLERKYEFVSLNPLEIMTSQIDGTQKFLFELSDGNIIESVWMQYKHGNSVCISSQVGCRMGCRFCASTIDGMIRSLKPSEMLDQIYAITRLTGERVSNVVVMGSGEPLDNYDALIRFIELLTNEDGLHISQRNLTVSTCGLVPKIRELADLKLQITLAISLHASTNQKRQELMPIARKYSLDELMDACRYYYQQTGRRMTFEYSLVGNVNDSIEDAKGLATLLNGILAHVNLIPVNPIKERNFSQSDRSVIIAFQNKLEKMKINVTIRREMGRDIDGACGQLRRRYMNRKEENDAEDLFHD